MPRLSEHKKQSAVNNTFFNDISDKFDSKYFDWKITTLFYEILHCAEALSAKHGKHHETHTDRNHFLQTMLDRNELALYRQLSNASRVSRYKAQFLTKESREYCIRIFKDTYKPLRKAFDEKYLN
jgi:hypothetical protein